MLAFRLGFLDIGWLDLLDIGLVTLLIYQIYNLVRGSVASRVFVGYLLVYLGLSIGKGPGPAPDDDHPRVLHQCRGTGPDYYFPARIRRFLLLIGKSTNLNSNRWLRRLLRQSGGMEVHTPLKPIMDACKTLSSEFSGGLMVLQKNDDLEKFVQSGEIIDADVTKPLLLAIFSQYSPLHDGAVIIGDGRIRAARCILPVSDDDELPSALGFRHRAALGMSEATDAAVITVSEESGRMALALNGELFTNLNQSDLESRLNVTCASRATVPAVSKKVGKWLTQNDAFASATYRLT